MKWNFWSWTEYFRRFLKNEKAVAFTDKGLDANEPYEFPCNSDKCLVRAACTKACEKIIMDDEVLMKAFLKNDACPDCGSEHFKEGPSGGMATNVKCSGCGHWFNFGLPLFIQRIHIDDNGVFR